MSRYPFILRYLNESGAQDIERTMSKRLEDLFTVYQHLFSHKLRTSYYMCFVLHVYVACGRLAFALYRRSSTAIGTLRWHDYSSWYNKHISLLSGCGFFVWEIPQVRWPATCHKMQRGCMRRLSPEGRFYCSLMWNPRFMYIFNHYNIEKIIACFSPFQYRHPYL